MKYPWYKTVCPIAAMFAFRMLGLFLLIPVFTVYAAQLEHATPILIGVALGSYGLSQGLLQIPFGMLSDKFGRKPIIVLGLALFAFGSIIGCFTDSIYGIIVARIFQGTGAIGSVLIALLADLTPNQDRTKGMAVIGITIGISFGVAMIVSPALCSYFGLSGIFYLTTLLAILGIGFILFVIPTPTRESFHEESEANPTLLKTVLTNRSLLCLDFGIFCQHFIFVSSFYGIPIILKHQIEQGYLSQPWQLYLPVMIISFIIMLPCIMYSEKKKRTKYFFLGSIALIALTQGILARAYNYWTPFCVLLFLYFVAFNILEAMLPSLASKKSIIHNRGTAMGVYSTAQFLGIFSGGLLSGIIYQWGTHQELFFVNTLVCVIWFIVSLNLHDD